MDGSTTPECRLPNLEIISSFGVGYDHIDARAAAQRGIIVTNTPGVLDEEVADTALGLMIMTVCRLSEAERYVRAGQWLKAAFPLTASLRGRMGSSASGASARRSRGALAPSGSRSSITAATPADVAYRYFPSLVDTAKASDILIVVAPGGAATRHLINAEVLEALGPVRKSRQIARLARRRKGADRGAADGQDPGRRPRRVRERAERAGRTDRARQSGFRRTALRRSRPAGRWLSAWSTTFSPGPTASRRSRQCPKRRGAGNGRGGWAKIRRVKRRQAAAAARRKP